MPAHLPEYACNRSAMIFCDGTLTFCCDLSRSIDTAQCALTLRAVYSDLRTVYLDTDVLFCSETSLVVSVDINERCPVSTLPQR